MQELNKEIFNFRTVIHKEYIRFENDCFDILEKNGFISQGVNHLKNYELAFKDTKNNIIIGGFQSANHALSKLLPNEYKTIQKPNYKK